MDLSRWSFFLADDSFFSVPPLGGFDAMSSAWGLEEGAAATTIEFSSCSLKMEVSGVLLDYLMSLQTEENIELILE